MTINGGELIVTNNSNPDGNGTATGVYSSAWNGGFTQTGGSITVTSQTKGATIGINNMGAAVFSNGTMTVANTSSGAAYGTKEATNDSLYHPGFTVSGGTITVTSASGTGYGLTNQSTTSTIYGALYNNTVSGGTVYGSTYGIVTNTNVTIGTNDDSVSTTSPDITGGSYGVQSPNIYFYDGVIRGGIRAIDNDTHIRNIAPETTIHMAHETIDNIQYEKRWLDVEQEVARINSTRYTSLPKAINAAEAGDTIVLLDNIYLYEYLTIPADKEIIIDLDGHNITTGDYITNNGILTITNSDTNNRITLSYPQSEYYIRNNTGASLTIDDVDITAYNAISGGGNLTITDASITTSNTAISCSGNLTIDNSTIATTSRDAYALYINGGINQITNSTINNNYIASTNDSQIYNTSIYQNSATSTTIDNIQTLGRVVNNAGTMSIKDSSISRTHTIIFETVTNSANATLSLDHTTVTTNQIGTWSGGTATPTINNLFIVFSPEIYCMMMMKLRSCLRINPCRSSL